LVTVPAPPTLKILTLVQIPPQLHKSYREHWRTGQAQYTFIATVELHIQTALEGYSFDIWQEGGYVPQQFAYIQFGASFFKKLLRSMTGNELNYCSPSLSTQCKATHAHLFGTHIESQITTASTTHNQKRRHIWW
jgi:hypothetical protein